MKLRRPPSLRFERTGSIAPGAAASARGRDWHGAALAPSARTSAHALGGRLEPASGSRGPCQSQWRSRRAPRGRPRSRLGPGPGGSGCRRSRRRSRAAAARRCRASTRAQKASRCRPARRGAGPAPRFATSGGRAACRPRGVVANRGKQTVPPAAGSSSARGVPGEERRRRSRRSGAPAPGCGRGWPRASAAPSGPAARWARCCRWWCSP